MTWAFGTPVRVSGVTFVPIVETEVSVKTTLSCLFAHGGKRPMMILVFRDDEVSGLDLCGQEQTAEEIEKRFPRAIDRATALLAADRNKKNA